MSVGEDHAMPFDLFYSFVLPALINVACTVVVLVLGRLSERVAKAAALLVLVIASVAFAPALLPCNHSLPRLLAESGTLMAIVWGPSATLALLASRSSKRLRHTLTIAALITALVFGLGFTFLFWMVIYLLFWDLPRSLGAFVCSTSPIPTVRRGRGL